MYRQMTFTPCLFTSQKKPQKLMNRLSNIFKFSTWWKIALKPCQRCTVSISNPFGAFSCSENSSARPHPQAVMSWQRLFSMDILALAQCLARTVPLAGDSHTLSAGKQHPAGELSESPQCSSDELTFLQGGQKRFLCSSFFMTDSWFSRGAKIYSKVLDFVPCFSLRCRAKNHYHSC